MSTVLIKIAGTDYTADIVFVTAEFTSAVNGQVGSCKFRVRDDLRTLSFATGASIELLIDGDPVWTGFLSQQLRVYAFPAENVTDAGLTRWLDIVGVDLNVLFNKRYVFTVADPTVVFGKLYGPNQPDNTAIADLVADYLDLSGDSLDTSTKVEFVGNINVDQPARAWLAGDSFGQAMASIASLPGAVYFIDPARFLVYADVNTASAPFGLSDQPGASTVSATENFGTPGTGGWPGWTYVYGTAAYASVSGGIASAVIPVPSGAIGQLLDLLSVSGSTDWSWATRFSIDPGVLLDPSLTISISGFVVEIDIYPDGVGGFQFQVILSSLDSSDSSSGSDPWDADWRFLEVLVASGVAELRLWKDGDPRPSAPTLSCAATTPAATQPPPYGDAIYVDINMGSDFGATGNGTYEIDYITITTAGGGIAVGYREMGITKDGTSLANDVLAWGLGYGSTLPVFDREVDATSESLHGVWQGATVRSGIYKQATINRVATSILDGSPSNQRGAKDDKVAVSVVTYVPGFLPAQKVDFTSAVWDFNDVIPIRRMRVTFDAPDTPRYELNLSHDIDQPWGFFDQFLLRLPKLPPLPPFPGFPPFPFCYVLDDFERNSNPGFGVVTPTGSFAWDPPVYDLTGGSTALAHVTGGVGQLDMTVTATEPNLAHHANVSESLPGVLDDLNEYRLSGHATMVHNFPAFTSPTSLASADLVWAITVQDDPTLGSYFTQMFVELTKSSPTGGPVAYTFHVHMSDNSGGVLADVVTAEQFVTALDFDWVIDRSATRGTIQMTMSHVNGGLPYESAITAGPAPVLPVGIAVEGDGNLQNHVSVDWSPEATNDDWNVCGASLVVTSNAAGYGCVTPSRITDTLFALPSTFVPNSTMVWASGILQRRGIDYTEGTDAKSIVFTSSLVEMTPVRVCYQGAVLS